MKNSLLIILVLYCLNVSAQQPYFFHYGIEDGLDSENVYDILQDNDGFIWISHDFGISSYDGFEFTHYQAENQVSFSGSNLQIDFKGRVWYQTFDGYFYFIENNKLNPFNIESKPIGYFPAAIIDSMLWTIDETGVAVYSINTNKKIKHYDINPVNLQSTSTDNNKYFLIFNNEIAIYNNDFSVENIKINNPFPPSFFKYLYSFENKLIIGYKLNETKQLFELKNGNLIPWVNIEEVSFLQNIYSDSDNFWVLTENGIITIEKNEIGLQKNHIFEGIPISKVIKDKQNNYWASSNGKGIFLIPGIKNTIISEMTFIPKKIKEIGNKYIYLSDNGVIHISNKKLNDFSIWIDEFKGKKIYDILADTSNQKLVLLGNIVHFIDLTNDKTEDIKVSLKGIEILDEKYYAVSGTSASGLLMIPGNEFLESEWDSLYNYQLNFSFTDNLSVLLPYKRGKSVLVNHQKSEIYFGTNENMYKVTQKNFTTLFYENKPIVAIDLANYKENIFIRTTNHQLLQCIGDKVISLHFKNLKGEKRFGSLKVQDDKLFFTHENLLYYYQINKNDSIAIPINLGINANKINDLTLYNNQLLILTDKELLSINIENNSIENKNFNFVINQINVNGKNIPQDDLNDLPHFNNNIEISYSILNFGSVDPEFFYKINNNPWLKTSRLSRTVSFSALAPGKYSITFKSNQNEDFLANIVFKIKAPFWKQWWFYGLVALFFISLFGIYYLYRLKVLKSQNKLLKEKFDLEKSLSESILTSIKSQMNPHFFYNALNTIQAYIFKNDKHNASKYLNKFSKLTRTILEMSDKSTISIKMEVDALNLYLELEKLRFENDFTYQINLSFGIDSEFYQIPPMLIQPYVENAIKHGLLHKEGNKILKIDFSVDKEDKYLTVIIDDNGIGREKSEFYKANKKEPHKSFATKATLKRLELINRERADLVSVKYIDKKNEENISEGTTVIIKIILK